MKIIQVSGRANTGKTTFIRNLIPELNRLGRVGVVKHLGDHEFALGAGKDTTVFLREGPTFLSGSMRKKRSSHSIRIIWTPS